MQLKFVEIKNYRSIRDVKVLLDPKCRVLVGINESGKSNILKALSFLDDDREPSAKDDVREALPSEPEPTIARIQFNFHFDKSETSEIIKRANTKILSKNPNPVVASRAGTEERLHQLCERINEITYEVNLKRENKTFYYPPISTAFDVVGSWGVPNKNCPADFNISVNGQDKPLSHFELVNLQDFPEIPKAYIDPASSISVRNAIGMAAVNVARLNLVPCIFWEYDEKNLLPSEVLIEEFAAKPSDCTPLWNLFLLSGVSEIRKELEALKLQSQNRQQNFFDRIAKRATSHFRSIWPELKGIEFQLRLDGEKVIPGIKEKNSFDFSKRSDGFKRFITFLLMISADVKSKSLENALLLIDEPEIGLHPSGARYLKEELIRIAQNNYVVFSTHSIFMIDVEDINRHYIVTKKNEVSSIESAKDSNIADEEVLYNALGHSIFSALKSKNLIFEGWKDKALFKVALQKASANVKSTFKDVGMCHANGAKHIRTITPMMEIADRRCMIVSDSDAPAKEQKKLFQSTKGFGEWNTYQDMLPSLSAITGEDFIKNNHIVSHFKTAIEGFALPKISSADLPDEGGKLKFLENWLRKNGIESDVARDILRTMKDAIFDTLTPALIEESYFQLVEEINRRMTKLN